MNRAWVIAVSLVFVLALLVPASAQVFEPALPLAVEEPLIQTLDFDDYTVRQSIAAIFEQVPGWTYTIHPSATRLDGPGMISMHLRDVPLKLTVEVLLEGSANSFTVMDTNYLIHSKDYVVPEPCSVVVLLSGIGGCVGAAWRRRK